MADEERGHGFDMPRTEEKAESHDLLFIGGLHKSGTSIFHRSVKAHSSASGFSDTGVPRDEGQLLQSVFPPANQTGGMGRFGFRDESHLTEECPIADESHGRRLFQEWSEHWDLGKRVLVEKSPPTLIRTRFLQSLFPDARFVILLRHPIPVSYSTSQWTDIHFHTLIGHWVRCHDIFEKDRPHIRRLLVVRYEDFVARPDETLKKLCDHVGLEPVGPDEEIRENINRKYLRRWTRMKLWPRAARYRRRAIERYGDAVERFGYGYTLDEDVWF